MADADGGGDALGGFELARGEAGADAGDGEGAIAQGQVRRLGDDGAVDAAGVGDEAALQRVEWPRRAGRRWRGDMASSMRII